MYNQDRKIRYIRDNRHRNMNLEKEMKIRFNCIKDYEGELGKDLCDFTVTEILDYYRMICTSSLEYLMVLNSSYKLYTSYCLSNGLVQDGQNHYLEIDQGILVNCLNSGLANQRIITREELMKQIKLLDNPSDQFMALAVFEGIQGKAGCELYYANVKQIQGNKIHLVSGRVLTISKELISFAMTSSEEYNYYCYSANGESKVKPYDSSDTNIIKNMYNVFVENVTDANTSQRMRYKMNRMRDFFESDAFKMSSLKESGRIHMIKCLMREQGISDLRQCYEANKEAIEYRYGKITSFPRYLIKYGKYYEE